MADARAAAECAREGAECGRAADAAPVIRITPTGGTYTSAAVSVTISWASAEGLDAGTRQVALDGADVTANFSYAGDATSATSSGTITLAPGANTLTAMICDEAGQCASRSAQYTYEVRKGATEGSAGQAAGRERAAVGPPSARDTTTEVSPMLAPPPPGGGTNNPPTVELNPSGGTYYSASLQVTVTFRDDTGLNGSSRIVRLNGVNVTSSFTYTSGSAQATAVGTVTLSVGSNTFRADICDTAGNCGGASTTYTYVPDAAAPTISISPSGGTFGSSSRSVTVSWLDDVGLNTASDTIWLNGSNVTGSFTYGGTSTAATSSGTVTLRTGSNTLKAKICDVAKKCTTKTASYTYDATAPTISVSPNGGGYASASLSVTIGWSDNLGLNASSRWIKLNGTTVTSSFTYSGTSTSATSSGTVTLVPGTNVLEARICDIGGTCGTNTVSYTYDGSPPAITVTPGAGTYDQDDLSVTVEWCDNRALDTSTRRIRLNGSSVTFTHTTGSKAGCGAYSTSTGTITLQPDQNTFTVEIADDLGNVGRDTVIYTYRKLTAPIIDATPHNGENVDVSLCAADCFDATLAYATPAYTSMDVARSATLVYRSSLVHPKPLVQLDVRDVSTHKPVKVSVRLKQANDAWVTFTNGAQELFFSYGPDADTVRVAAQFDASGLVTGAYTYTAVVRSWWSDGTMLERTRSLRVLIISETASPFGAGWTLAGLQRLHFFGDSVLVTEGGGNAVFFGRAGVPCDTVCRYFYGPGSDFSELRYDPAQARYVREYKDGTKVHFSGVGRMTHTVDRFGNQAVYGYDGAGRLATITDPAGKMITFTYGADGKLDAIEDPVGRRTVVTIDAAGDLTAIADPGGLDALRATYDAARRIGSWTDRGGNTSSATYDAAGKLASVTSPPFRAEGTTVQVTARFVSWHQAVLPPAGTGSATSPAPGLPASRIYAKLIDAKSDTTRLTLDRWSAPLTVEDPFGYTSTFERNANGQVTRTTDPKGQMTTLRWSGPIAVEINAPSGTIQTGVGPFGQPGNVTGDVPEVTRYYRMDSASPLYGVLDSVHVEGQGTTRYTYDARGRLLSVVDSARHRTDTRYLSTGWQNTDWVMTDSLRKTSYTYDAYGRVRTVKDPEDRVTTFDYDVLNRERFLTAPDSTVTEYVYGSMYLDSIIDAEGQVYTWIRNELGWSEQLIAPGDVAGVHQEVQYDRHGRVIRTTNRRGQVVSIGYDHRDRMITRTADGQITTYAYSPDDPGQPSAPTWVAARNSESTDTLHYDARGRLTKAVTWRPVTGGGTARYVVEPTYNALDMRTALAFTAPGRTASIAYGYDGAFRLDTLRDVSGQATSVAYNGEGLPSQVLLPNNRLIRYGYISNHGLGSIRYHSLASDSLQKAAGVSYRYDTSSRITERWKGDRSWYWAYDYDAVGQLGEYRSYRASTSPDTTCYRDPHLGEVCGGATSYALYSRWTYGYDAVGNRTDAGAVSDPGNRLVAIGGWTLEYDADGNLLRKAKPDTEFVFDYNSLGQLVAVHKNGQQILTYGYDGFGRRVRRSSGSATMRYVYDEDDLLLELDAAGAVVAEYTYYPGVDAPHSVRRGGQMYYYATDHQGSVLGLVNASNQVVNAYQYDPYGGIEQASEGIAQPLRYTGREYESETGLYYYRARYYDPDLGRFLSEDPIGLSGGINLYAYVGNDPVNYRDPYGLKMPCTPWYRVVYRLTEMNGRYYREIVSVTFIGYRGDCEGGGGWNRGGGGARKRKRRGGLLENAQICWTPEYPAGEDVSKNIRKTRLERRLFSSPVAIAAWVNRVWFKHRWDFKNSVDPKYEAAGNHNFGATGSVLFTPTEIFEGAAWAHRESGHPPGDGVFGDNLDDSIHTWMGIDYQTRGCPQILGGQR